MACFIELALAPAPCIIARMSNVTQFLGAMHACDPKDAEELLPLVYDEVRRLTAHKMANEVPGQCHHKYLSGWMDEAGRNLRSNTF